ncbi:sugar phosphate isomerase [Paenibacillus swuensis]|uniref:Sugar phosphate isomerase n=1 Tax=Paenibacillus swuensis TaxID=1178515 RepID=A0A172TGV4_9BACL|nr:sugar phosphate isomerase/epimerase family protein [Paenibacillus swuensis]ANE46107.1 sugar phosphate isomerase [Paenibacillus swuensis]
MKVGLSSYSVVRLLEEGTLSILDLPQWIKEHGGEHLELAPLGYSLLDDPQLADQLRIRADEAGIELSNYCISANFVQSTRAAFEEEVERVKKHVDLAARLRIPYVRHDVTGFSKEPGEISIGYFERVLPELVEGSRCIADYAATFGITTSIENHGFCVQASDRVRRVVEEVDRANFRTTLDVGNFLCVDEQPWVGVMNNISLASVVHFKDFYIRPYDQPPGEGPWFQSTHGNYLRGAILGQGDLNIPRLVKIVKDAGYDGYVTVEFEGIEDSFTGSRIGMDNLKRMWNEA